jgi:hypothetical protein
MRNQRKNKNRQSRNSLKKSIKVRDALVNSIPEGEEQGNNDICSNTERSHSSDEDESQHEKTSEEQHVSSLSFNSSQENSLRHKVPLNPPLNDNMQRSSLSFSSSQENSILHHRVPFNPPSKDRIQSASSLSFNNSRENSLLQHKVPFNPPSNNNSQRSSVSLSINEAQKNTTSFPFSPVENFYEGSTSLKALKKAKTLVFIINDYLVSIILKLTKLLGEDFTSKCLKRFFRN